MAETVGHNPTLFVNDVDDTLLCAICQNVVDDPAELPCGHLFCLLHIQVWFKESHVCPTCRAPAGGEPKTGSNLHLAYRRMLSDLKMRCENHKTGCTKVSSPADMKRHLAGGCEFSPSFCRWDNCPYHVKNRDMGQAIMQKDLAEHEMSCEHRIVKCEFHGCMECVPAHRLAVHTAQCSQVLVPCTVRGCDAFLPRGALKAHMEDPALMPRHMTLLSSEVSRLSALLDVPELVVNDELVFSMPDCERKFSSSAFRFETKMFTLGVFGRHGYNFRVQLRKREWPEDRRRFNDKLGIYLHIERSEIDDILVWPFPHEFTFTIVDQTRVSPEHITFCITDGATRGADWLGPGSGKGWGPQGIASFDTLRSRNYVKNDNMLIKVTFHRDRDSKLKHAGHHAS